MARIKYFNQETDRWDYADIAGAQGPRGPEGPQGPEGPAGKTWADDSWVDLSGSQYNQNKWYPVVGSQLPDSGFVRIEVAVHLNSGTKPSWTNHGSGFSVNFIVDVLANGWGTTSGESLVMLDTFSFVSDGVSPISFQQMYRGSRPVIYARGGGKYRIKTATYNPNWKIYANGFSDPNGDSAPVSSSRPAFTSHTKINANSQNLPGVIPDDSITASKLAANSVGTSELQSGSVNSAIIATNAVGWDEFNTGDIMPKITSGRYTSGTADAQIPTSWSNEIRVDIPSEGTYVIFGTVSVNAMGGQNATVYISMDISGKAYEEFVSGGWARQIPFLFVEHATAGAHYVQLKRGGGTTAITYSYKRTSVAAIRIA